MIVPLLAECGNSLFEPFVYISLTFCKDLRLLKDVAIPLVLLLLDVIEVEDANVRQ